MTAGGLRKLATIAGWTAVIAAPFVTHAAIATGRLAPIASAVALMEVALFATIGLRRLHGWARLAGIFVAAGLVASLAVRIVEPDWAGSTGLIAAAWASHAFIYGSLLLLFGRSLLPGRVDLITALATRVRGNLTPGMLTYTRGVTKVWCSFFCAQLMVSALLLVLAPIAIWSIFVNLLDGPSVVALFLAEYAVRRIRFRGYKHISPAETFRNFARSRAGGA